MKKIFYGAFSVFLLGILVIVISHLDRIPVWHQNSVAAYRKVDSKKGMEPQ